MAGELAAVAEPAAAVLVRVVAAAARAPAAAQAVVAAAADDVELGAWLGPAGRVAARSGLSSRSAAPAVNTQELRLREGKTEKLRG